MCNLGPLIDVCKFSCPISTKRFNLSVKKYQTKECFAGKQTQINYLKGYLRNHLLQVEPEREPVAGVAADIVHHSGLVQPPLHLATEQINMKYGTPEVPSGENNIFLASSLVE